ncbi:MAG: tetratricopeptide repeat protein [Longimicrobiales bacterium]
MASSLSILGNMHWRFGVPDSAIIYWKHALTIVREAGDRTAEQGILSSLANLHAQLQRPDSAEYYFQQSLLRIRANADRAAEVRALTNLGSFYQWRSGGPPKLAAARARYDSAAAIAASLSPSAGSAANRTSSLERDRELFGRWVSAWLAGSTADSVANVLAALAAAEQGRAQALLHMMGTAAERSEQSSQYAKPGRDLRAEAERLVGEVKRLGSSALVYFVDQDTLAVWFIPQSGPVKLSRHPIAYDSLAALGRSATRTAGALIPFAALPVGAANEPLGIRYAVRYAPRSQH